MIINQPILYADDDEDDAFLFERAFKQVAISNPLTVVPDGQALIDYLVGNFSHRDKFPVPCLILLDVNMPGKNGIEVLKWIRSQSTVSTVPVLMLTSSNLEADVHRAYLNGANGYLVKPNNQEKILVMAKAIKDFWLTVNQSPREAGATM